VEKEHFFCRACITRALERKRSCPCCRTYLTINLLKRHSWAIEAYEKAKVKCPTCFHTTDDHSEEVCSWTGKLKDLKVHLSTCMFNLVRCPYEGICSFKPFHMKYSNSYIF
jgi:hypothetical protein